MKERIRAMLERPSFRNDTGSDNVGLALSIGLFSAVFYRLYYGVVCWMGAGAASFRAGGAEYIAASREDAHERWDWEAKMAGYEHCEAFLRDMNDQATPYRIALLFGLAVAIGVLVRLDERVPRFLGATAVALSGCLLVGDWSEYQPIAVLFPLLAVSASRTAIAATLPAAVFTVAFMSGGFAVFPFSGRTEFTEGQVLVCLVFTALFLGPALVGLAEGFIRTKKLSPDGPKDPDFAPELDLDPDTD